MKIPSTVLLNNVSLQVWLWVDLSLCADVHKSDGSQMVHFCIYPFNCNCRGAKSAFQSCGLDLCVSLNTQTGEQKYFNLVPMFPPLFAATQAHFLSRHSSQLAELSLLELNLFIVILNGHYWLSTMTLMAWGLKTFKGVKTHVRFMKPLTSHVAWWWMSSVAPSVQATYWYYIINTVERWAAPPNYQLPPAVFAWFLVWFQASTTL